MCWNLWPPLLTVLCERTLIAEGCVHVLGAVDQVTDPALGGRESAGPAAKEEADKPVDVADSPHALHVKGLQAHGTGDAAEVRKRWDQVAGRGNPEGPGVQSSCAYARRQTEAQVGSLAQQGRCLGGTAEPNHGPTGHQPATGSPHLPAVWHFAGCRGSRRPHGR